MNTTFNSLRTILVETFNLPPERLTPDATLAGLDIDSLATVELLWQVEEVFKISLPSQPAELLTLADVVRFIDALVAQSSAKAAAKAAANSATQPSHRSPMASVARQP